MSGEVWKEEQRFLDVFKEIRKLNPCLEYYCEYKSESSWSLILLSNETYLNVDQSNIEVLKTFNDFNLAEVYRQARIYLSRFIKGWD